MTTAVLDQIMAVYLVMFQGAYRAMYPMGLAILVATMAIEFYLGLIYSAIDGFMNYTKLLGVVIALCIQASVVLYVLGHLPEIAKIFWDSFLQFAFAATGSGSSIATLFTHPSELWSTGFRLSRPLMNFIGWPSDMLMYRIAAIIIVLMFMAMAVHIVLATLEFQLVGAAAVPFVALGVLGPLSFFLTGVLRWAAGVLVRVFVLAMVLMGIIIATAGWTAVVGPAPGQDSAWVLAGVSIGLAIASWVLPSIAAGAIMAGGHGLGAGALFAAGMVGVSSVRMGAGVIRAVSSLVRGR